MERNAFIESPDDGAADPVGIDDLIGMDGLAGTGGDGETGGSGESGGPVGLLVVVGQRRWRIESLIGAGSTSQIYRAAADDDVGPLPAVVAIKLLSSQSAADRRIRERFLRECSLLCTLSHPGLIHGIAHGFWHQRPFLIEELCIGRPLSQLLTKPDGLGIARALDITADLLVTLNFLYLDGRVSAHRDIKPGNILVQEDGRPRLVDLGIAKSHLRITSEIDTGFLGTIAYMAPEQIDDAADTDIRTDLYSLGVVFYEMCSGQRAFADKQRREMLVSHLTGDIPQLDRSGILRENHRLYDECTRILCKSLALERVDRFQTPAEFFFAVNRARDLLRRQVMPASRRRKAAAILCEVAALCCAAVGVGILLFIIASYLGVDWAGFTLL